MLNKLLKKIEKLESNIDTIMKIWLGLVVLAIVVMLILELFYQ